MPGAVAIDAECYKIFHVVSTELAPELTVVNF